MARRRSPGRRLNHHRGSAPLALVVALAIGLLGMVAPIAATAGVYFYFARDLPSPETVATRRIAQSTKIYDREGRLLYEVFDPQGGRRTMVPLSEMAPALINATIATEDADFYTNPGFSASGVLRAVIYSILGRDDVPGGSTITQQLVRNVLLLPEERTQRTITRKAREIILAMELTRRYTKDQILEWYLNEITYGNVSYGVEAAARSYFGKSARDLSLAESAMLAGLPQSPTLYSPIDNPDRAKARQEIVLDLMARHGYLTTAEANAAKQIKLSYQSSRFAIEAPHFVMYIREALERRYGVDAVYRGGLRVTTTLDLELQKTAQDIVKRQTDKLKANKVSDGALVALRPQTGEVLAMVGSADYFDASIHGQVNLAVSDRQPGSAFKPITYAAAFLKGWTPATMLLDIRTVIPNPPQPPYSPNNIDYKFFGPMSVRTALANSRNVPAVAAIVYAGVQEVINLAHRLGISTLNREGTYGPALTLGGGEVKLLDLAYAYSAFANGGRLAGQPVPAEQRRPGHREVEPVTILRIEDAQGRVIEEFKGPTSKEVISPQIAYLLTDILSDNNARSRVFGSSSPLKLSRPAAAKTGTSEDWRDVWTAGYTPDLVTAVWMGNADNSQMAANTFGSISAAAIWHDFMEAALAKTPPTPFTVPPGIVRLTVCDPSGLLPTLQCAATHSEVFVQGTEPKDPDNMYQVIRLDKTTGKRATASTPPENVEEKVFLVLPPEAADWARDNNVPQPPTEFATPPSGVVIASPAPGSAVRGRFDIVGSTQTDHPVKWSLDYGPGTAPSAWSTLIADNTQVMRHERLTSFDTTGLDGVYTLRLTVQDEIRGLVRADSLIHVDTVSPTVQVIYPTPGSVVRARAEPPTELMAVVTDNVAVARVEFFVDGALIGEATVSPYFRQWSGDSGRHSLEVVAYDRAGNTTRSAPITFEAR